MKKQTLGVIAGAAGAALLLGGGTFALWSDSATVDGGTIIAGNLDVNATGANWFDTSVDRADGGHAIDLATFRIIPGDTISGKFGVDVGLEGENLLAKLNLATPEKSIDGDLAKGLTLTYTVEDASGKQIATGDTTGVTVELASPDNGNKGNVAVASGTEVDGTVDFNVVVSATFDSATSKQDLVKTQAELAKAGIELNQVRAGQGFK